MDFLTIEMINYIFFGIIIFLSFVIISFLYFFFIRKNDPHKTLQKINNSEDEDEAQDLKTRKKKKKKGSSGEFEDPNHRPGNSLLDFDNICNDMLINNNISKYSMIIQCRGINFDLMSEREKNVVQENFIKFLNNLIHPIQIHVQTRVLDLKSNATFYIQKQKGYETELQSLVIKFNELQLNREKNLPKLSQISKEILKKQKLLEYARDLQNQVELISKNNFVLQNNYFIIISCNSSDLELQHDSYNNASMDLAYSELTHRCNTIIKGLQICGVDASILKSKQIVQLLYSTFNQEDENYLKLKEILDSGIIRLYSTSKQ